MLAPSAPRQASCDDAGLAARLSRRSCSVSPPCVPSLSFPPLDAPPLPLPCSLSITHFLFPCRCPHPLSALSNPAHPLCTPNDVNESQAYTPALLPPCCNYFAKHVPSAQCWIKTSTEWRSATAGSPAAFTQLPAPAAPPRRRPPALPAFPARCAAPAPSPGPRRAHGSTPVGGARTAASHGAPHPAPPPSKTCLKAGRQRGGGIC